MEESKLDIGYYSEIEASDVRWLWYPYIPYGKITVLQGDPGEGKSTLMIQVAAALTKAEALPDGKKPDMAVPVIYQCSEDGLSDTVKPRLIKAGADCGKIAYLMAAGSHIILKNGSTPLASR